MLFTRFGMGDAPTDLQQKLVGIFLNLLAQDTLPGAMAFYGEGVKLTCEGSPVLASLQDLSEMGVPMIICQTCLDYFGIRGAVRVAVVGGMGDIMAAMGRAEVVISV